jgi:cysteine desulfurase
VPGYGYAVSAMDHERTYLDHAATTPMLPEAIEAMTAELRQVGNPSSLHAAGRRARRTVEEAREIIAESLGARPSEVIFTSGGTEADNLAVKGIFWARRAAAERRRRVVVSAVEHHAILDAAHWLEGHEGAVVEQLPVDGRGRAQVDALRRRLEAHPDGPDGIALVSIMWANNEVGTVQPIRELAALARAYEIPFHTDAVQAIGHLPVDFAASGASAMTITGHKIGGPVGVGALLLARGVDPVPVLHGGGQERDVRSGTLDAPAIAGLAAAVRAAVERRAAQAARLSELRDELVRRVLEIVPDAELNGDPDLTGSSAEGGGGPGRLPGNAHFSFPGCEGDALLMLLDAKGVDCSTGSACSAGVAEPSHVLLAMGADPARARGSLRFSLGHTSGPADIEALAAALGPIVERARAARGSAAAPGA